MPPTKLTNLAYSLTKLSNLYPTSTGILAKALVSIGRPDLSEALLESEVTYWCTCGGEGCMTLGAKSSYRGEDWQPPDFFDFDHLYYLCFKGDGTIFIEILDWEVFIFERCKLLGLY